MLTFNGVPLNISGVKVADVEIGMPQIKAYGVTPAIGYGSIYASQSVGERTIKVTLTAKQPKFSERFSTLREITAWATTEQPAQLVLDQLPGMYINAKCTSLPDYSIREWWQNVEIEFTAFDPFFYSSSLKSQSLSNKTVTVESPYTPVWQITQDVSKTLTSPTWALGSDFITLSTATAGQYIIDSRYRTITKDGASVLANMTLGSRFFQLKQGENILILSNGAEGIIRWRERWL